jgi:hypothetical protein
MAGATQSEIDRLEAMYLQQFQPIQMPYQNGYVLIDAKDLCHQQFIPLHAK